MGLVTGVAIAHLENHVICVDKDTNKLERLQQGIPTFYEPGLPEILTAAYEKGFLSFSSSVTEATKNSDIIFIAVGTPSLEDGSPDLSAVFAVVDEVAGAIDSYKTIIVKSTVPVGSSHVVEARILARGVPAELFDVVSNPEFLRQGTAVQDTLKPTRIVIGSKSPRAAAPLKELYAPIDAPLFETDATSAEMIKYASNSFLALKISYINAISRVCEASGANVSDVAFGMGGDPRIGPQFLQAGLGWGGSCFPKDVQGLIKTSEALGYDFALLKEVAAINDDQTLHFVDRLRTRLGGFEGKLIGLLGLAFKPNTDDIRDAKSLVIIETILREGGTIQAFDPVAMPAVTKQFPQVKMLEDGQSVAESVDAVILVTEWNEFKQLDLVAFAKSMRQPVFFDGRRLFKKGDVEAAGLEYTTIGA